MAKAIDEEVKNRCSVKNALGDSATTEDHIKDIEPSLSDSVVSNMVKFYHARRYLVKVMNLTFTNAGMVLPPQTPHRQNRKP